MKIIQNFKQHNCWFLDKDNKMGPLQMAFKWGSEVAANKHYHRSTHEYFLVLQGEALLRVNEKTLRLTPNSLIIVEPKEIHSLTNASKDFKVILIMDKFVPNDRVDISG